MAATCQKEWRKMRYNMYNFFKEAKKGFLLGYNAALNGGGCIQIINDMRKHLDIVEINNVPMYFCKSNYAVASSNSDIGCLMEIKTKIIGDIECIFVNDTFDKAPDFVKEFILHHELGHFVHGDLHKVPKHNNLKRLLGLEKIIMFEYNADRYAAQVLSPNKCIDALNWMETNVPGGFVCRREMKKRIKELQKM